LSIRSINDSEFKYLKSKNAVNNSIPEYETTDENGKVEPSKTMISFISQSKIVTLDTEKLNKDIKEISKDKTVPGKGLIEQQLAIVFDKDKNSLTSRILNDADNTNTTTDPHITTFGSGANSYATNVDNPQQIILALVHTHPLLNGSIDQNPGSTTIGSHQVNAVGVSEQDRILAKDDQITNYAIETFNSSNFISKVDQTKNETPHFAKLNDQLGGKINLLLDAFNTYTKWHK
jgi:hypothetical protein